MILKFHYAKIRYAFLHEIKQARRKYLSQPLLALSRLKGTHLLRMFGIALITIVLAGYLLDERIARYVTQISPSLPLKVVNFFTNLGSSLWWLCASAGMIVLCFFLRLYSVTSKVRLLWGIFLARACYFFVTIALSGIIIQIPKYALGRARPLFLEMVGPYHFSFFSFNPFLASFPSGHTTTAFAVACALAYFWPSHLGWFFSAAVCVAISRLLLNMHYLSDVLFGALCGSMSAVILAHFCAERRFVFDYCEEGLQLRGPLRKFRRLPRTSVFCALRRSNKNV